MKWIMLLLFTLVVGIIYLIIKGMLDAIDPDESELGIDEHSPENLDDIDKTIRLLQLKEKLNKIEEERN
jgi:hypothetical protein